MDSVGEGEGGMIWENGIETCIISYMKQKKKKDEDFLGTSLAVQWLRLHASNARGVGSIPGQGTKCPHAAAKKKKNMHKQKKMKIFKKTANSDSY